MQACTFKQEANPGADGRKFCLPLFFWCSLLLLSSATGLSAQSSNDQNLSRQIQELTAAMARTQSQLEQSQRELEEMRQQLNALQSQMANRPSTGSPSSSSVEEPTVAQESKSLPAIEAADKALQEIEERQAMQESQIATHEQSKVESESKYPVKITGLVLFNGFVNTSAVDVPTTPMLAIPGTGSTGGSVRQTMLGFNAEGPHLFGARTYADLRIDFDGNTLPASAVPNYSGYSASSGIVRLRTAHAGLLWPHMETYFAFDRPIFSPDNPTSLTAVAIPPLAWSGNLWTWNPQAGVTGDISLAGSKDLRVQAALIDVGGISALNVVPLTTPATSSFVEQSHWPGFEGRVALLGHGLEEDRAHIGVGGFVSPDRSALGHSFNSWAAALDVRLPLPARLQLSGSFYRGLALGSLGAGAYKDFVYRVDPDTGNYYLHPLDDVGGWVQLKEKINQRIELNGAFGTDQAFAGELRRYAVSKGNIYQNLARNRTYTGNVIFSPSAYFMFSLEYRHLDTAPVIGSPANSNVIGVAAGYKF